MNNNTGRKRVRRAQKKSTINRILLPVCLIALLVTLSIGGTLAWLTDYTTEVKNTFTPSNIDIELDEGEDLDLEMVPGKQITKNPLITINQASEKLWLFVKVNRSENFDDFMTYEMDTAWTAVPGATDVYYQKLEPTFNTNGYPVLKDDQVKVKNTVTKKMMDELYADTTKESYPTLSFTAYAIQQEYLGTEDAAQAWVILNTQGFTYDDTNGIEFGTPDPAENPDTGA